MADQNVAYIFASGPSLLNLTDGEKAYLNAHPQTLAMNKYLMYWEMVGVLPHNLILADSASYIAKIIATETLSLRRQLNQPITYYMHHNFSRLFARPDNLRSWINTLYYRWTFWKDYRYGLPISPNQDNVVFIDNDFNSSEFTWAQSLDEPLYHYRGSLTAAINLAAVLFPQADIKLLGVDMTGYSAFYELDALPLDMPRYHRYRAYDLKKENEHHRKSRQQDVHVTAQTRDNRPGVQSVIPQIRETLQAQGRDLYCCNPESLLVVEGACPYAPVLSES